MKNGKLNGTILEIGPDFMETTKIKGSVIDGETKVHTSTQREGLKESYVSAIECNRIINIFRKPFTKLPVQRRELKMSQTKRVKALVCLEAKTRRKW